MMRSRPVTILCLSVALIGCTYDDVGPSNPATETYAPALGVNVATMTKLSDDLYIQDVVVGTGAEATSGKRVTVKYAGYLVNGFQFDAGTLQPFTLGQHGVILGFELGIAGMKVGGKRKLVIGSTLGYGSTGNNAIPPHSTLVFDVELLSVTDQ